MSLPMSKATYRARAISAGFGTSSKGNNQIGVQCEIVDHEEFAGETITWLGHFTEKTTARTVESLQHFGWQGDDLSELEDLDAARAAAILPEIVEIVVDPEQYEGEWQLKVKWVNKPGAGRFSFKEPLTGSGLKAFAAQMKGTIRGAKAAPRQSNGSGGSRPQQPHPNAPGNKDDIPFASTDMDSEPSSIARVLR